MKRPELSRKQITLIMAGSMLTLFLAALDNTIVGTAMPKIIRDLQGMEHYAWPFTAYMLFSTIVLPISGKLADIYGRRKITLLGIAVFMLTSALCGFSRSMTELSILRGFQGIGGGICTSSAFIIVSEIFPLGQRARYMGLIASMFALASIMGPGAGGFITDDLSWRWVFFVNITLSMIAFFLIFRHLPVIIETDKTRKMDIPGAVFFVLALLPLLLAVSQIGRMPVTSPFMAGLLAFSLLRTILFLRAEKRSAEPLLNLHYFRDGIFTTSVLGSSFAAMAIFGAAIYMPLYIQGVRGQSATRSGLILMPMTVSMILGSNIGGQLVSRLHKFKPIALAGLAMSVAGLASFGIFGKYMSLPAIMIFSGMAGLGTGLTFPVFSVAPQSVFPPQQVGVVTSLLQFFRNLGSTMSSAIFGAIMMFQMNRGLANVSSGNLPEEIVSQVKSPAVISNPHRLGAIRSGVRGEMLKDFDSLTAKCVATVSGSIEIIFLVASIIVLAGLVIVAMRFNERKVLRSVGMYRRKQQG